MSSAGVSTLIVSLILFAAVVLIVIVAARAARAYFDRLEGRATARRRIAEWEASREQSAPAVLRAVTVEGKPFPCRVTIYQDARGTTLTCLSHGRLAVLDAHADDYEINATVRAHLDRPEARS